VAASREAYHRFGAKPSEHRSSMDALQPSFTCTFTEP
jgi:DNA/RNA-binding domain of Phe-tRNA-synthetase-like protein